MILIYLLLSVVLIVLMTARWRIHPFIALLVVAILYGLAVGMPFQQIIASVNTGFSNTLGGVGMIIILGVIIGAFLEHSGGAYALAKKIPGVHRSESHSRGHEPARLGGFDSRIR